MEERISREINFIKRKLSTNPKEIRKINKYEAFAQII